MLKTQRILNVVPVMALYVLAAVSTPMVAASPMPSHNDYGPCATGSLEKLIERFPKDDHVLTLEATVTVDGIDPGTYYLDESRTRVFQLDKHGLENPGFAQGVMGIVVPVTELGTGKHYLMKSGKPGYYALGPNEIEFNRAHGLLVAVITPERFIMRRVAGQPLTFDNTETPSDLADLFFHFVALVQELAREYDQIHGDLGSANVKIEPNGHWQAIDFGRSKHVSEVYAPVWRNLERKHPGWSKDRLQERIYEMNEAVSMREYSQGFLLTAMAMLKRLDHEAIEPNDVLCGGMDVPAASPHAKMIKPNEHAIQKRDYLHMFGYDENMSDVEKLELLIAKSMTSITRSQ